MQRGNEGLMTILVAIFGKWSQVAYVYSTNEDVFADHMSHPLTMMT